ALEVPGGEQVDEIEIAKPVIGLGGAAGHTEAVLVLQRGGGPQWAIGKAGLCGHRMLRTGVRRAERAVGDEGGSRRGLPLADNRNGAAYAEVDRAPGRTAIIAQTIIDIADLRIAQIPGTGVVHTVNAEVAGGQFRLSIGAIERDRAESVE